MDEDNVKVDEKRVRANASNAMARSDLSRLAGMQFNNDRTSILTSAIRRHQA